MLQTYYFSREQLNSGYIPLSSAESFADGEFAFVALHENPSAVILTQKFMCELEGGSTGILRICYDSEKDLYPAYYFPAQRLMYHSLMYLRHLPAGLPLRPRERERLSRELASIRLTLEVLRNAGNARALQKGIWCAPDDTERAGLLALCAELPQAEWALTDTRRRLFGLVEKGLAEVERLRSMGRYKKIREVGYALHNVPEMICRDVGLGDAGASFPTPAWFDLG